MDIPNEIPPSSASYSRPFSTYRKDLRQLFWITAASPLEQNYLNDIW
ncbi:hypothetical protein CU011_1682 [Enterococcus faecium]|nr:hypothetical protein [Enterococcus faecium]EJY50291.1 hypothetical protein HMPREF1347_01443 [Enterococcus faecium 504]MBK4763989.1 hypothetical protein [Enterococcus faecium]MBK4790956.1 hypothetical protein [Enterococcus faecium]MBK4831718.1 hypothetical protein [Enterococcus faecium]MBK4835256.1 hypothetical protein [Enterococcus faecium]